MTRSASPPATSSCSRGRQRPQVRPGRDRQLLFTATFRGRSTTPASSTSPSPAIAEGDTDLAARLMAEHIDTTQQQFERKIRDRIFTLHPPTLATAPTVWDVMQTIPRYPHAFFGR